MMCVANPQIAALNAKRPDVSASGRLKLHNRCHEVARNGTTSVARLNHLLGRNARGVFVAKSPSAWHDDARDRDAGHDEMQLRVLRDWQRIIKDPGRSWRFEPGRDYKPVWCAAEFALISKIRGKAQVEAFADIAIEFASLETDQERERREARNRQHELVAEDIRRRNPHFVDYKAKEEPPYRPQSGWLFLEVKPVVHSAGAVLRQCAALDVAAGRAGYGNFDVRAVVYEDDPKAGFLRDLGGVFYDISREAQS